MAALKLTRAMLCCVPSYPFAQAGRTAQEKKCLTHAAKDNFVKVATTGI
jgi:hypothetical protein